MITAPFIALSVLLAVLAVALRIVWVKLREARRADFIRSHALPKGLIQKLQQRRPELAAKDGQLVARALRQFFLAHLKSGRRFVAMPSQVADDLWHEFILCTRHYDAFCNQAFGGFLHHTPAVFLAKDKHDNAGLRRVWWQCCKEENINPAKPTRLPLLFALDAKLGVADGFHYTPDCSALQSAQAGRGPGSAHCGGDFSSPAFDGGTDGFADGSPDGGGGGGDGEGGGGGDGGGDGGGGCGGD